MPQIQHSTHAVRQAGRANLLMIMLLGLMMALTAFTAPAAFAIDEDPTPPIECAAGSTYNPDTGLCSQAPTCGEGTHDEGGFCVADLVACNEGTHLNGAGDACIADEPVCDAGYHLNEDRTTCIVDEASCPTGQRVDAANGSCVAITPECEAGTHLNGAGDACVADEKPPTDPETPRCDEGQVLSANGELCESPKPQCAAGQIENPVTHECDQLPVDCAPTAHLDVETGSCVADVPADDTPAAPTAVLGATAKPTAVAGAGAAPTAVAGTSSGVVAGSGNVPYTGMPLGGIMTLIFTLILGGVLFHVTGRATQRAASARHQEG